jgi:hypothetical protein
MEEDGAPSLAADSSVQRLAALAPAQQQQQQTRSRRTSTACSIRSSSSMSLPGALRNLAPVLIAAQQQQLRQLRRLQQVRLGGVAQGIAVAQRLANTHIAAHCHCC